MILDIVRLMQHGGTIKYAFFHVIKISTCAKMGSSVL